MRYDALVIGGSFAGLSAAIYLARARRSVCIIDAGAPRNRFAQASHGFFGQDGQDPRAMIEAARAQVAAYPSVTFREGEAIGADGVRDAFTVTLASGERLDAARLLLAFGLRDVLPEVEGLSERWGTSVLHCPYCHGYEFAGRPLGVLQTGPASIHQAEFVREWGPVTFFLDGGALPDPDSAAKLAARGIAIEPASIRALEGAGRHLSHVALADGRKVEIEALYVAPRSHLNSRIPEQLGCAVDEGILGPVIRTDETKETTIRGVFAAGDIARAPHSATWASADGVTAGTAMHRSLVFDRIAA
ncbi:NAD(P)/FAD-dependent oxidoreductase [Enterovirga rhinocerotis]|uniref:Thioredoxin reductase n=1 Tax=Enterovirga rhinocerotis TaxID=1339210 RepID=A0A4R7BWF5_9HYPH|nr:NAD(P)/FAD-dependent oxidoreductase [Enterovirga rhinocerotis]TDR90194.1 thioredoxin reductase [Enterovirga rhinocerotis]